MASGVILDACERLSIRKLFLEGGLRLRRGGWQAEGLSTKLDFGVFQWAENLALELFALFSFFRIQGIEARANQLQGSLHRVDPVHLRSAKIGQKQLMYFEKQVGVREVTRRLTAELREKLCVTDGLS